MSGKYIDQLIMLDTQYRSRGLEILAFPCNQFFWREYSERESIKNYLIKRGVNFHIFEKVEVNGRNSCELYKYLRKNSILNSRKIGMNFCKFLVDRNGEVFGYYGMLTNPVQLINDIELHL